MPERKWTPGPWEREDTEDYAEIYQAGMRPASPIALVGKPADANLIAATPELLEALKAVEADAVGIGSGENAISDKTRSMVEAAMTRALLQDFASLLAITAFVVGASFWIGA
jgi:hypothetical protein